MDILLGIKMPQREQVLAPSSYPTLSAAITTTATKQPPVSYSASLPPRSSRNTASGSYVTTSPSYESANTVTGIAQPLNSRSSVSGYPQRTLHVPPVTLSSSSYVGKGNTTTNTSNATTLPRTHHTNKYVETDLFGSRKPQTIVPRDFFIKLLILREGVDEAAGGGGTTAKGEAGSSPPPVATTEHKNAADISAVVSSLHLFIKSERRNVEKGCELGPTTVLNHSHAFLSPDRHGERGEVALFASPEGERNTLYDFPPRLSFSELPTATSKREPVLTTNFDHQNDDYDEPALEIPKEIFFAVPDCRSTKQLFRSIQRKIRRDLGIPYLKAKAIYFREDLAEAKKRERDAIEQKLQELVQLGSKTIGEDGSSVDGVNVGSISNVEDGLITRLPHTDSSARTCTPQLNSATLDNMRSSNVEGHSSSSVAPLQSHSSLPPPPKIPESIAKLLENARRLAGQGQKEGDRANFSSGQAATTRAPSVSVPSARNRSESLAGGLISSRRSSSTFSNNPSPQNFGEDEDALVEGHGTKENVISSGIRSASINNNNNNNHHNNKNNIVETPPSASLTPLLYPKSTTAPASEASDDGDEDKEGYLPPRGNLHVLDLADDNENTHAKSQDKELAHDHRNLRKGTWYSLDDEGNVSPLYGHDHVPLSARDEKRTSPDLPSPAALTILTDLPLTTNPPIIESVIQTKARRLHLIITCLRDAKEVACLTSSTNNTNIRKDSTIDPFTGLPTELFQRKGTVYASNLSDLSQFVAKVLGVAAPVKNHQILFCNPHEHERHGIIAGTCTNSLGNKGVSLTVGGNATNNYGFEAYVSFDRSSSSSSENDEKSDGRDSSVYSHFSDPYGESELIRKKPSTALKRTAPSILQQMSGGTFLRDSAAQQNAVLSYLNGAGGARSTGSSGGVNTDRSSFHQPHTNLPTDGDTLPTPSLAYPAILLYKQLQHIGQLAKVSYIICDLTDRGDGQLRPLSGPTSFVTRQQRESDGAGRKSDNVERSYEFVEPKLSAKDTAAHGEHDRHDDARRAAQGEAYSLLPVDRVGKGHYPSELAVYKPEFDLTRSRVSDDRDGTMIHQRTLTPQRMKRTHPSVHHKVVAGRVGDGDLERREVQNDFLFGSSDHERGGDISFSSASHERGGAEYHEGSERWGRPPRDSFVQHFRAPDLSAVDSLQATSGTYVIDFGKQVSDEAAVKGFHSSASHSALFSDKPNNFPNGTSGVDGVKLRTPVPQDAPLFLPSSRTCYNNPSVSSFYDAVNASGSQQTSLTLSSSSCSAMERRALIQFTLNHYIQTHPTALKIFTESQLTTLTGEVVVRFRKEREATHGNLPLHFPLSASDAASLRRIADTVASEVMEQKQIRDAEQRFLADNGLLSTVKKASNNQATKWQNFAANSSSSEVGGSTPLLREFTLSGFYDENNNDTSHDARLKMRNRIDPYYVPPVPSVRAGLDPQSRQALALREAYEAEYAAKLSRRIRLQTPTSTAKETQVRDERAGRKGRDKSDKTKLNGYYVRQPILYEDEEEREASDHHHTLMNGKNLGAAGKNGNAALGPFADDDKNRNRTRLTLIALPLKFTRDDFSSDSEDEKSEASQTSYPRDRNDPQWLTNNRKRSVRHESRKAEVIATLKRFLSNAAATLPRPPSDPFKRRIVMADPQWDQTQKRLAIYITTSIDIFGGSSVAHAKAARGYLSSSYFIRGDGNMSDSSRRTALTSLYDKGPPPFRFYVTTGQRRKPVPIELASLSTEQVNLSGGGWPRSGSTTNYQTATSASSSAREDHQDEHHFADDIGLDALLDLGIATVHVIQHTVPVTFSLEIDLDPERDFRAIEGAYNERVQHIKAIAGRFDQQSPTQVGSTIRGFAGPEGAPLSNANASSRLSPSEAAIECERRKFLTDTYSVLFNRYMSLLRAATPRLSHPFTMDDFHSSSFSTTPKTTSDVDRKIAHAFFKSRDSFALLQDAAAVSSGSPRQLLVSGETHEGHNRNDVDQGADSPDANTQVGGAVDLKSPTARRYPVATSIFVPSLLREGLSYTVGVDVYDAENDVVFRAEKGFAIPRGAGLAISFDEYLRRAARQAGYRY